MEISFYVEKGSDYYRLQDILYWALPQFNEWLKGTPLLGAGMPFEVVEASDKSPRSILREKGYTHPEKGSAAIALWEAVKNSLDSFADLADQDRGLYLGSLKARLWKSDGRWNLELEDNGTGIPRPILERLFRDRFPGGSNKDQDMRLGSRGQAFFSSSMGGRNFLPRHNGEILVQTFHKDTGAADLLYRPSFEEAKDLFDIRPGARTGPGTTIRWTFAEEAVEEGQGQTGAEELNLREFRLGLNMQQEKIIAAFVRNLPGIVLSDKPLEDMLPSEDGGRLTDQELLDFLGMPDSDFEPRKEWFFWGVLDPKKPRYEAGWADLVERRDYRQYRKNSAEKADAVAQTVWQRVARAVPSLEQLRGMTFEQFAQAIGAAAIPEALPGVDVPTLVYVSPSELERYQNTRPDRARRRAYSSPELMPLYWWESQAVNAPGLYYFPQQIQWEAGNGIQVGKAALFHELLEQAFLDQGVWDQSLRFGVKIENHTHFSVLVEELRFAALVNEWRQTVQTRNIEIQRFENQHPGNERVAYFKERLLPLLESGEEPNLGAGEARWAQAAGRVTGMKKAGWIKNAVDTIRAQYHAREIPARDTSKGLSELMIQWIAELEGEERAALISAAQEAGQPVNAETYTAATGGLGRGDDFLFEDDIDLIVFPADAASVEFSRTLQKRLLDRLEQEIAANQLPFRVDRSLTQEFDYQQPPEQVAALLLDPERTQMQDVAGHWMPIPVAHVAATPFRDFRWVAGNREVFESARANVTAPVLYPYGKGAEVLDQKGHRLIERLLIAARMDETLRKDPEKRMSGIDVKEDALRPIQQYVWAIRARLGLSDSSVFQSLAQLPERGVMSVEEAAALSEAYDFFLRTREALKRIPQAEFLGARYTVHDHHRVRVAQNLGMDEESFRKRYAAHFNSIRTILPEKMRSLSVELGFNDDSPAGLEEAKPMSAEEFGAAYGERLLVPEADLQKVQGWLGRADVQATVINLPAQIPLYVKGDPVFWKVVETFPTKVPKGLTFVPILLPTSVMRNYGLILRDTMFPALSPEENPYGLRVRDVALEDVPNLDPVQLALMVFQSRLGVPESNWLGAYVFKDAEGQAKLVLLHSA